MENSGKKIVYLAVPREKSSMPMEERQLEATKQVYCKHRKCNPDDIIFVDFLHNLMNSLTKEEIDFVEQKAKYPGLQFTADAIALMGDCDEVCFGINWHKSKMCKVLAVACEKYFIPQIRVIKKVDKKADDSESRKEYKTRHQLEEIYL